MAAAEGSSRSCTGRKGMAFSPITRDFSLEPLQVRHPEMELLARLIEKLCG